MSAREVSNSDDVIDSRDVIARIEELENEQDTLQGALDGGSQEDINALDAWESEGGEELKTLLALAEQCEGYSGDWPDGATLIRESYFQTYAEELAGDIGAIDPKATWPNNCIDWERAARELAMDYTHVDFDGVTYLVR